jgi:hypothetical protein
MSRLFKLVAAVVVAGGMMAAAPQAAQAQHHHHGGWHHGGGWGYGSGFALGFGLGAAPYYGGPYYGGPYYGGGCGWVRQRFLYRGYWRVRRVWRGGQNRPKTKQARREAGLSFFAIAVAQRQSRISTKWPAIAAAAAMAGDTRCVRPL